MKKKNILVFMNSFWNDGKGISGGDQMFIQIFKRIQNKINQIFLYTNRDGEKIIKSNKINKIKFFISNQRYDKFTLILNYLLRTYAALSCLGLTNIDIIYSTSDFFPDVFPAFLYKFFHKKGKWIQYIFHIYPNWYQRPGNKLRNLTAQFFQQLSLIFIKKADCIVNINTYVKQYLCKKGFDPNKIIINTPGINYSYLNNLKLSNMEQAYDGVFLSRLMPSKGIFDLIKIWKEVVVLKPNLKLAIIGGGSNTIMKALMLQIQNQNLQNNIYILGYLNDNTSFIIVKKSKVFLFPSHEEGFGIAIAEAMVCQTPVIAWHLPIYDEIFENNMVKVEENNITTFSAIIIKLIDNIELRKNISKKAHKFIKKYDWNKVALKQLKLLDG